METNLDQAFAALSDPARRDLVYRLAAGPQTAGALAEPYDISRPAISRHLRVLREAGLVTVEAAGRQRWYALAPEVLAEAESWLDDIGSLWAAALSSLKSYVEEGS